MLTLALIAVLKKVLINLERESIIFGQNNNMTNLNSTKIDTLFSTEGIKLVHWLIFFCT